MVQASHAALEAGIVFGSGSEEPSSLIVLGVDDQSQLNEAFESVRAKGIDCEMFFEPDWEYGNTAFGTQPIPNAKRKLLKGYSLWKP